MELLRTLHRDGATIVVVTHESEIAEQAERVIHLRDGRIESDTSNGELAGMPRRDRAMRTAEPSQERAQ
jgi:putative ABC transport system ATP-binding protein